MPGKKSVVPHGAGCDGLLIYKAHDWSNEGTGKGGRHVFVCGVVDGTDGSCVIWRQEGGDEGLDCSLPTA